MKNYINMEHIKSIRISDFLAALGHYPIKKSGKELFYHSMLRETAKNTPSLSVWDDGGKWIDRAGANQSGITGGGIIQLALAYWPDKPFIEVLHNIKDVLNLSPDITRIDSQSNKILKNEPTDYAFELVKTKPLGTNFILTKYLESRGIYDVAQEHFKEVYYKNHKNKQAFKSYYAIGWQNEHNNWEFTNTNGFKSSIGAKGISALEGKNKDNLMIFEGYMDYLSWLKVTKNLNHSSSVYVLNSIALLNKTIVRLNDYKQVELFLDNDAAGRQATQNLLDKLHQAIDRSSQYKGFKDFNEMLVDKLGSKFYAFNNYTKR